MDSRGEMMVVGGHPEKVLLLKGLQVTLYYGVISIFTFLLYISVSSTFHC